MHATLRFTTHGHPSWSLCPTPGCNALDNTQNASLLIDSFYGHTPIFHWRKEYSCLVLFTFSSNYHRDNFRVSHLYVNNLGRKRLPKTFHPWEETTRFLSVNWCRTFVCRPIVFLTQVFQPPEQSEQGTQPQVQILSKRGQKISLNKGSSLNLFSHSLSSVVSAQFYMNWNSPLIWLSQSLDK